MRFPMNHHISDRYFSLLRLRSRLAKKWRRIAGKESTVDMRSLIPFYKKMWQDASELLHADFGEVTSGVWRAGYKNNSTLIHNYKVQIDDPVVLDIAGDKPLCYRLLRENDLPVPEHQAFNVRNFEAAKKFMDKHDGSLFVVKPSRGTSGSRGVTTHIRTFRECCHASALASLYGDDIIIERMIVGESYRLLVLGGNMIHATRRRGLRFTGDGESTVSQLIVRENERRRVSGLPKIASDHDLCFTLQAQGLTEESVLRKGREVLVKSYDVRYAGKSELRTTFNENVTDLVCRDLRMKAVRAAYVLNSGFTGIDIITLDPAVPLSESGGVINEVNTTPGLHHHYNLINGNGSSPAVDVLKYLLETAHSKKEL